MAKSKGSKATKGKASGATKALNSAHKVAGLVRTNPAAARQLFLTKFQAGAYKEALELALAVTRLNPKIADAWADATVCYALLEDWPNVIKLGLRAIAMLPGKLNVLDALSHAYGAVNDLVNTRKFGLLALEGRARSLRSVIVEEWQPAPAPIFNPNAPERNVIAFCLFGSNPKYCETAILNALAQPTHYPHWRCWFYVDASVPSRIKQRLRAAGGKVLEVSNEQQRWPGPMWRFAAYDAPDVDRVIFRDCDSIINPREAAAVKDWIDSGQRFHMMRDAGSHTELILAGMWGVTRDALPAMHKLVAHFLLSPVESAHFADQYFLRAYVWPYAVQSLLQHDSVFGFMAALPFQGGICSDETQVGYALGASMFEHTSTYPPGTALFWSVVQMQDGQATHTVCSYADTVKQNGKIRACLPRPYTVRIKAGELSIVESLVEPLVEPIAN